MFPVKLQFNTNLAVYRDSNLHLIFTSSNLPFIFIYIKWHLSSPEVHLVLLNEHLSVNT